MIKQNLIIYSNPILYEILKEIENEIEYNVEEFLSDKQLSRHIRAKTKQANELNSNSASIKINEGDLLIFPAYLPHSVEENKSNEDRVIVSFNIDILK